MTNPKKAVLFAIEGGGTYKKRVMQIASIFLTVHCWNGFQRVGGGGEPSDIPISKRILMCVNRKISSQDADIKR